MSVGFDNTVTGKCNVSRVIPRLYGWIYKILRLSPLVDEHSVVVISARLNPMGSQFSIPILWKLCSESDTGGPSSFTVRMEYLCAFQYWYCELYVENWWAGGLLRANWNRIFFQPVFFTFESNLISMWNTALVFSNNIILHILLHPEGLQFH